MGLNTGMDRIGPLFSFNFPVLFLFLSLSQVLHLLNTFALTLYPLILGYQKGGWIVMAEPLMTIEK